MRERGIETEARHLVAELTAHRRPDRAQGNTWGLRQVVGDDDHEPGQVFEGRPETRRAGLQHLLLVRRAGGGQLDLSVVEGTGRNELQ